MGCVAEGGGLGFLFGLSNFRFRRILNRSPIVEVVRSRADAKIMRGGYEQALSSCSVTSSLGVAPA